MRIISKKRLDPPRITRVIRKSYAPFSKMPAAFRSFWNLYIKKKTSAFLRFISIYQYYVTLHIHQENSSNTTFYAIGSIVI